MQSLTSHGFSVRRVFLGLNSSELSPSRIVFATWVFESIRVSCSTPFRVCPFSTLASTFLPFVHFFPLFSHLSTLFLFFPQKAGFPFKPTCGCSICMAPNKEPQTSSVAINAPFFPTQTLLGLPMDDPDPWHGTFQRGFVVSKPGCLRQSKIGSVHGNPRAPNSAGPGPTAAAGGFGGCHRLAPAPHRGAAGCRHRRLRGPAHQATWRVGTRS